MIPSTPALFSAYKFVFIAFLLFTMLFIVMLSNGIILKRLACVAPSISNLHGLNGGKGLKSTIFGFWTLHRRLDTGDFHTNAALTIAIVSAEFVLPVSSGVRVLARASIWCVMLNAI
nr:hypothetical protein CFP56_77699 [Quercus suber]POF03081.1 hypothetical protein CFP56_43209 [Quercus suber]